MSYVIEQRDDQLVNSKAAITYELSFDSAPQHLVHVRMRIERVSGAMITLVMPVWAPGSYKVRDYAGWQGNVEAYVIRGGTRSRTTMRWRDKTSLEVTTGGAEIIEVTYVIYGHERTVRTNHINRMHAFIMPVATLMYVEGRMQEVHHVLLKHDQKAWPQVSTQLSTVRPASADGVLLGALNYDLLADSPSEIGDHVVRTFTAAGAKHELAICGYHEVDADWMVEQLTRIVTVEAAVFGGVPYDRYVFIIWAYPGIGGGLEHARSSVNAVDPSTFLERGRTSGLLSLLTHEYFHLWNVKRIRPVELGPFDYTRETYTSMLWLAEGMTSYYDDLFAYRCGFLTQKEYINTLAGDHIAKLLRVPGRFRMSVRDSSTLAWIKLYMQSPDANNRFPSYYLKGGVVMLLLDLHIIDHTDGRRTLDDGLRAMWEAYKATPERGMTEAECIALLERGTGVQLRDLLNSWLDGTSELPFGELLGKVGLQLDVTEIKPSAITFGDGRAFASVPPAKFYGWSLADQGGRILVKAVEDDTPAQMAGLGIDDEIVAVDGKRVTSTAMVEQFLAERRGEPRRLTCHCDGRMFETTITPAPVMVCSIKDVPTVSARQQQLRDIWLKRHV
jgi:predicted metalloprotease with PDZ domain